MLIKKKLSVAVLGAGNMGTALALMIARNGHNVKLWNHAGDLSPLEQIKKFGENKKYLSGIKLLKNIYPEANLEQAVRTAAVIFFVVPSNFMEGLIKQAAKFLACGVICVDASKGLDEKSLGLVSDVIEKNLPKCLRQEIASISGPAIARDMVTGGFTAMNIASVSTRATKLVRVALESPNLKLVATNDMVGVEIAGSFKNVYAIAMGICDGLKYPLNTKAALLVIALKEIAVLIKKMGGEIETVYDLAGLGDLVGTSLCSASRNRRLGEYLALGMKKDVAIKKVGQVAEGINASKILVKLSRKYQVEMPFAKMIYQIVWQERKSQEAIYEFLQKL
ncbi:MAG: NAD(P)H-dependent glycerol-3-phosphate dehydrogenase [Candidatus Magasanikbacteria bacterium]